jgi:hypothetical protein
MPMLKYWVKRDGEADDEALGILVEDGSDVSDLLQAAAKVIDFGCKPSELKLHLGDSGPGVSNRDALKPDQRECIFVLKRKPAPLQETASSPNVVSVGNHATPKTDQQTVVARPPIPRPPSAPNSSSKAGRPVSPAIRPPSPRTRIGTDSNVSPIVRRSVSTDRTAGAGKGSTQIAPTRSNSAPRRPVVAPNSAPTATGTTSNTPSGTTNSGPAAALPGARSPLPRWVSGAGDSPLKRPATTATSSHPKGGSSTRSGSGTGPKSLQWVPSQTSTNGSLDSDKITSTAGLASSGQKKASNAALTPESAARIAALATAKEIHSKKVVESPCPRFEAKWGTPAVCSKCGLTRLQHWATNSLPIQKSPPRKKVAKSPAATHVDPNGPEI